MIFFYFAVVYLQNKNTPKTEVRKAGECIFTLVEAMASARTMSELIAESELDSTPKGRSQGRSRHLETNRLRSSARNNRNAFHFILLFYKDGGSAITIHIRSVVKYGMTVHCSVWVD